MMSQPLILGVGIAYLLLLFAIAWLVERRGGIGKLSGSSLVYTLSLAVYCSSWTFNGGVGRAALNGFDFLPIYLGPTLVALLWWMFLRKMIRISKANRITSLADFVASRYGKSSLLAGFVTVIAVVGILPYISLQLKAVSNSFTILSAYPSVAMPDQPASIAVLADTAFYVAVILAGFTIALPSLMSERACAMHAR